MSEIEFEIERELGVISESSNGWTKELNLVSFNGRPAKYDIRVWAPHHEKMGKGVTFTGEEFRELYGLLKEEFTEFDVFQKSTNNNTDFIDFMLKNGGDEE